MGYFYLLGIRTLSVGKFTVDFSTVNENVLELSRETINLSLRRLAQQDCFNWQKQKSTLMEHQLRSGLVWVKLHNFRLHLSSTDMVIGTSHRFWVAETKALEFSCRFCYSEPVLDTEKDPTQWLGYSKKSHEISEIDFWNRHLWFRKT